jgi:hypothetical protein
VEGTQSSVKSARCGTNVGKLMERGDNRLQACAADYVDTEDERQMALSEGGGEWCGGCGGGEGEHEDTRY